MQRRYRAASHLAFCACGDLARSSRSKRKLLTPPTKMRPTEGDGMAVEHGN
jgi:hypothetical protein